MRSAGILALVGMTSIANAAPPEMVLGDAELELRPRRDVIDAKDDSPQEWVRFAGFAQITGGGRAGGDAGAGAALAVGGANCDLVAGTVHGRFRPLADGGEPLGRVTYSVCPLAVLVTIKFDGHREAGISPGLDARRSLWNRAYTDVYDHVTFAGGPLWDKDGAPVHTFLSIGVGHGTTTQTDDLTTRTIKRLDIDLSMYELRHLTGFGLDAVSVTGSGLKAGTTNTGGVTTMFVPLRLHYDRDDFYANADAGWGLTGGQITASGSTEVNGKTTSSWNDTIDSKGLPEITDWVGSVEAGVRRDRISATGRAARSFYPTFDGNFARESRVAGTVTYTAGRTRRTTVSVAPFAARTRTWVRDAGSTREISAGAQIHIGRELNQQLRLDAVGEAGVSPYARSESERLPGGTLGGQLMVALSGRVTDLDARRRAGVPRRP